MHKKCYWCRWGVPTVVILGMALIVVVSFLSYKFVYPLFQDREEILLLREQNYVPAIYPIEGRITGTFRDIRTNPITKRKRRHRALDIACPVNSKIRSTAHGYIEKIELTAYYGIKITILHASRKHRLKTVYAHLYKPMVKEDDFVLRGQMIGLSGNTGSGSGPHLHYEIWKSYWRRNNFIWYAVDPLPYCKGFGK